MKSIPQSGIRNSPQSGMKNIPQSGMKSIPQNGINRSLYKGKQALQSGDIVPPKPTVNTPKSIE